MNTIDILDRLIAISIDSEKRYRHAARDVGRASLETFFNWQADNRKAAADELHAERQRIARDGKEHGTFKGLADRAAMDFAVAMSKGDTGVVEWCKEDDEAVKAEYEKALAADLPQPLRLMIQSQYARITNAVHSLEEVISIFGEPRS
jgi:uncharacterized protein (TIGR02284 family)